MGYFDDEKNVDAYEKMADGYDGRALVERLRTLLPAGSTVLELGMGPGKDLDMLRETYEATGSDSSQIFVNRYRARHPGATVEVLDAVTLETDRKFDAIYSNKVLQHLSKEDAARSLARQAEVLAAGGLLMHALWRGEQLEEHHGLRFQQYTEHSFAALLPDPLELVSADTYTEMEDDDSMLVVVRKP